MMLQGGYDWGAIFEKWSRREEESRRRRRSREGRRRDEIIVRKKQRKTGRPEDEGDAEAVYIFAVQWSLNLPPELHVP